MKKSLIILMIITFILPYCAFAEDEDDIVKRHENKIKKYMAVQQIKLQEKHESGKIIKSDQKAEVTQEPFDLNFAIDKARTLIAQETGRAVEDIIFMYSVPYANKYRTNDGLLVNAQGDYRYFIKFRDRQSNIQGWAIDYIGYNPETKLWEKGGYGVLEWMLMDETPTIIYKETGTGKQIAINENIGENPDKKTNVISNPKSISPAGSPDDVPGIQIQGQGANKDLPKGVSIVGDMAGPKSKTAMVGDTSNGSTPK